MSLEQVNSIGTSTPGKEHYTIKEELRSTQMSQEQFKVNAAHFMNGQCKTQTADQG